jgi:2-polyprenyl-3-methyl-5-hydroxy-6-metoxy-1,4-benzoquinol methylase
MVNSKALNEIKHGRLLSALDTEKAWGWGTPAGRERAKRRSEMIARGAKLIAGMKVLEIGCGTGLFTELFAETGIQILAVDISDELLKKARRRPLPEGRVQFVCRRFEDCDAEGPFDAVIGSSILHHLNFIDSIKKIFELLRPGGVMSFAEPNMLNPQVFIERRFRKWFPLVSPDETAFVRWNLVKAMQQVGFVQVETLPFDWLHPVIPKKMIGFVQGAGLTLERFPGLREFSGSIHIRAMRPASALGQLESSGHSRESKWGGSTDGAHSVQANSNSRSDENCIPLPQIPCARKPHFSASRAEG